MKKKNMTGKPALRRIIIAAIALPSLWIAAPAQTTPTIKVESRIVLLDIAVTDKQGNPVTDLKPEEFKIYEKKTEQKMLSFEPPSLHTMPPDTAGKFAVNSTADLARIGDSPIAILVLDELNMNFQDEVFAREKLIQWLTRQPPVLPQPTALSAVTYTNFDLLHDFTQDRDVLLAILKKHAGGVLWRADSKGKVGDQASENMAVTLGALERISQAMRGVPGRKNLIWVGDGFPSVNVGDTGRTAADEISTQVHRLSNIMLHARVTLSVVGPALKGYQPVTIASQADDDMSSNSTDTSMLATSGEMTFGGLAPPTGGHSYSGRNDLDAEIGRSVAEGQSYYTISYRPSEPNDDPKEYRGIHVEVTRPGLVVHTRDGYFGEPTEPEPPGKVSTQQLAFDLNGAATSNFQYTDLHMKAERVDQVNFVVRAAAKDMTWLDLPDGRRHADVIVMAACLSRSGRMLSRSYTPLGSTTEASLAAISLVDATLHVHVTQPPGTVRIRFVVRDMGNGRVGTADLTP